MSRAALPSYQKPAAVLALMVHGGFFALLYFGFTWQTQAPAAMSVELWQALPDRVQPSVVAPPPVPLVPKAEPAPPVPSPVAVVKPDIVLAIKKPEKKIIELKATPVIEPPKTRASAKPEAPSIADLAAARELAEQAEQAAAVGRVVDEAMSKISSKIRRNIVMPPDVANEAQAIFAVTLLPGGAVLSARLAQSSGNAAYDNAVERAILKSQPLPLPADASLFNRFRELKLKFKPVE
ncbi:MAG: cell envelope integrity protein TolA [Sideroxydans sp.]|nr:cell envelope integrity protein TolA [Sideroxydans sp.]